MKHTHTQKEWKKVHGYLAPACLTRTSCRLPADERIDDDDNAEVAARRRANRPPHHAMHIAARSPHPHPHPRPRPSPQVTSHAHTARGV
jgi:hypothetical protein